MEEKSATRDIYWHFPCSLSPHKKVLMESLQFPGVSLSFSGCCHAILPTCRKSAESMLSHVSPFSADMAEFAFMDDSGVYSSILFQKHNGIKRVQTQSHGRDSAGAYHIMSLTVFRTGNANTVCQSSVTASRFVWQDNITCLQHMKHSSDPFKIPLGHALSVST